MGAGLVTAAYAVAARLRLDHAPTRLYVYMANTALDSAHHPEFWKGRDALAQALGKSGTTGHRAAGRVLELLVEARAVECVRKSAPGGRNARYVLLDGGGNPLRPLIDGGDSLAPVSPTAATQSPANGGDSAPNGGDSAVTTAATQSPLEEKEEEKEEGTTPPSRTCPKHPPGWSQPCRACGEARRAADACVRPKRRAHDCHIDGHRRVSDGTCMYCAELRPEVAA